MSKRTKLKYIYDFALHVLLAVLVGIILHDRIQEGWKVKVDGQVWTLKPYTESDADGDRDMILIKKADIDFADLAAEKDADMVIDMAYLSGDKISF